jgi:prophage regulatory protein
MNAPKKFLRLPTVIERVGLQKTAIYARIAKGTFPKPVQLAGGRAVAWDQDEVTEWQNGLERGVKPTLV